MNPLYKSILKVKSAFSRAYDLMQYKFQLI